MYELMDNTGSGCVKCECDMYGSVHNDCDDITGQCVCKPGVGGPRCSACLVGYWGISPTGCVKCSPCKKKGHVCDPDTGRCVCPVLTEGEVCERCAAGTWNYDAYKGCTKCRCHQEGSVYGQCDTTTGKCRCLEGYEGDQCDRCAPGFYNFPNCRACNCNPAGTLPTACKSGVCQCDEGGVCPCKPTVSGKKCASCSPGYFGLSLLNPDGCTECFCFGRSTQCTQAQYAWTQLVMPRKRQLSISRGDSRLPSQSGLIVIPGTENDVVVGVSDLFRVPLYWRLSEMFLGDKVLSYNGYLRFNVETNGERMFGPEISSKYPLVLLRGNHNIRLQHFPKKISGSGRYEVQLTENDWTNEKNPLVPVSRAMLMIALQGVEDILLRATDSSDATRSSLQGVSLDSARPSTLGAPRPALGVEMCSCPPKYNATSCQDPGRGFYRYYKESYVESEIIIDLLGDSIPCLCNGRADTCDPHTGFCQNCTQNTAGAWCDICAAGYYGDPMNGGSCRPCLCPASERNFAVTCSVASSGAVSCQCQEGYTGPSCERCAYGYYGNPEQVGGQCLPCDCNPFGSETDQCDIKSGKCYCVSGVQGRDCSQCKPRHLLTHRRECKNCNNSCVGPLLDTLEELRYTLDSANADLDPAPGLKLNKLRKRTEYLEEQILAVALSNANTSFLLAQENLLRPKADLASLKTDQLVKLTGAQQEESSSMLQSGHTLHTDVQSIETTVGDLILYLENHGRERASAVSLSRALSDAAQMLRNIKARDFREIDINTRTEMSEARILYDKVARLVHGQTNLSSLEAEAGSVDALVNDLLQYLTDGMTAMTEALVWNQRNNGTLARASSKCQSIADMRRGSADKAALSRSLMEEERRIMDAARTYFSELSEIFRTLAERAGSLEQREMGLSAVVEDYRTRFVLPCQRNSDKLADTAERIAAMFEKAVGLNADQAILAANSYRRIIDAVNEAREAAGAALDAAQLTFKEVDPRGRNNLRDRSELARLRSEDLRQEAQGLWKNAEDMGVQTNSIQLDLEKFEFDLEEKVLVVEEVWQELEQHSHVSAFAQEVKSAAAMALAEAETAHQKSVEMMRRVREELGAGARELNSFSAEELAAIPRKLGESQRTMQKVEKQAVYMERRTKDLYQLNEDVGSRLKELRNRIKMARQAASNVQISITGEEEVDGACLRSYEVGLSPSTHLEISLIYGIQSEARDSLLVFLPASERNSEGGFNFIALEMVDRKIRLVWNLGAGTQSILHNVEIESAVRLDRQDTLWYRVTAERIGNIGRLNVRKVQPRYDLPAYHQWVVGESPPTANILNVQEGDKIWVGGAPNYYRTADLKSGGKFAGVVYELLVNKRRIGLWDFSSSLGCRETYPGVTDAVNQHSCHAFAGDGYAVQDQIRNYDPRYYAISLEFKTYDENALLVMVANHRNQQNMVLQLIDGTVRFSIEYGENATLEFSSKNTYNSGQWVKVEAGRAYRKGQETGVLRVTHSGVREDLMDTLPPILVRELEMAGAKLYFGGVPPDFPFNKFPRVKGFSLLGNMRGITTSNPGSNSLMNPLYTEQGRVNPFYGVDSSCEHRILKSVLCHGQGHLEVKSQPLRRDSSFGLSFRTRQDSGLLLLSTFLGQPSGNLGDFYSVSLTEGRLHLVLGHNARAASFTSERTYNDGASHSIFMAKQANKVSVYIDDVRVDRGELTLPPSAANLQAPLTGGLYLGGVPSLLTDQVKSLKMVASADNFVGTIKDVAFIDEVSVRLIAMNDPVAFFNVAIGREG